jgi:hypothetical protein
MAKEPEDRPTADMLAKQLRAHTIPMGSNSVAASAASSPFVPPTASAQPAAATPHKKSPVFLYGALAGTAAALVLIAAAIVFASHNKVQPASAETPLATVSPAPAPAPQTSTPAVVASSPPAPKPAELPVQIAAAPVVPATPAPATPPAVSEPAPDVRAAVAAVVKPGAPVEAIQATDAVSLLNAAKANHKIAILGSVAAVHIDSTQRLAVLSLAGNADLHVTYYQRLYGAMTKKFGGKDGNGLVGKPVRITGYSSLLDGKPQLIINTVSQVELEN